MNWFKKLILIVLLCGVSLPTQAAKRSHNDADSDISNEICEPNKKRSKFKINSIKCIWRTKN